MNRYAYVRRAGLALLAVFSTLAVGSRASAEQAIESLTLSNIYNSTPISFSYTGGSTTVSGGGEIASATLNGMSVTYLYCLQWNVEVVVGTTYGQTLVNNDGLIDDPNEALANGNLVVQPGTGANAPWEPDGTQAKNVAWLIVNLAYDASQGIDPVVNPTNPTLNVADAEAGLQAAIWAQVTPGFNLTSTGDIATAYNDYTKLLTNAQNANGGLPNVVSQALFISPSTDGDSTNFNQALLGYDPGVIPFVATPEPATFAMALSGLIPLGLVALARRRRRASTTT